MLAVFQGRQHQGRDHAAPDFQELADVGFVQRDFERGGREGLLRVEAEGDEELAAFDGLGGARAEDLAQCLRGEVGGFCREEN